MARAPSVGATLMCGTDTFKQRSYSESQSDLLLKASSFCLRFLPAASLIAGGRGRALRLFLESVGKTLAELNSFTSCRRVILVKIITLAITVTRMYGVIDDPCFLGTDGFFRK